MQEVNVAYVDAYLAAVARAHGEAVATFDADFKRLGVELVS
ncbi:MAG: PIN domain-containing protein [Candidatus Limnocylindria bacterium]|nr:PIN domain-containing protein [Candidatus Limnocylindria bacterium]